MKQDAEEAAPKMPAKPTLLLRGRREPGGVWDEACCVPNH